MAIAELVEGRIEIECEFREKEVVKLIPGSKWDTDRAKWWVPLSWAACCQLRGVFGTDLAVGEQLAVWSKAELAARINPCLALRTATDAPALEAIFSALKPFQRAGVMFLTIAQQALLADEMGLGKTAEAIAAMELLHGLSAMPFDQQAGWFAQYGVALTEPVASPYPALIVCPNSMKIPWQLEFARWAPSREVAVIAGTAVAKRKSIALLKDGIAQVAVINYEALRGHTRVEGYGTLTLTDEEKKPKELNEIPFATVLADEAHRAKDPRSKQTRALWWMGRGARYRFALSGTPIANSPEDAWTLMRFIAPQEFPAKTKFIERYAQTALNVYGFDQIIGIKSETSAELFRILDPRFVRRTKEAVLPQLPPKQYSQRYCEMSAKQKRAYKGMADDQLAQLDSGILMATNPLTKLTRLLQFASAYGEFGTPLFEVWAAGARIEFQGGITSFSTEAEALAASGVVPDSVVKDKTPLVLTEPSCKVDALLDVVDELGDQQAIVFAESSQLINLAAARLFKEGYQVGTITGAVTLADRATFIQEFNERRRKLLLITLGAGSEGLSFPGCSTEIFLQRSFSLIKNVQAEDRCHGIGRGIEGEATNIIDIITQESVEARVHASGAFKADMAEQIVRDADTVRAWLAK